MFDSPVQKSRGAEKDESTHPHFTSYDMVPHLVGPDMDMPACLAGRGTSLQRPCRYCPCGCEGSDSAPAHKKAGFSSLAEAPSEMVLGGCRQAGAETYPRGALGDDSAHRFINELSLDRVEAAVVPHYRVCFSHEIQREFLKVLLGARHLLQRAQTVPASRGWSCG